MHSNEERSTKHEAPVLISIPRFVECVVEGRLNRFVVAVRYGKESKLAHINNTGRLLELLVKGREVACLPWNAWNGKTSLRKTSYRRTSFRLFAVREEKGWALIDTQFQMRAFEKAVEDHRIAWLKGYRLVRRNPHLGDSVLDYLLGKEQGPAELFLETKSAVLREGEVALYPDCPTMRGQRHVRALMEHAARGGQGAICFVAALPGITAFMPSVAGDPVVTALIMQSRSAGVDVRAVAMHFDGNGILLDNPNLPVLSP
jgi:sugar fermentation stimulation protein A